MKKLIILFTICIIFISSCKPLKEEKELSKSSINVSDVFAEYENGPKVKKAEQKKSDTSDETDKNSKQKVDIDFSELDTNMIYSIVYNMIFEPEQYSGKTIRIRGESYSTFYEPLNKTFYTVIVKDATACCAQGLSYILPEGAEYPEDGLDVEVTGVFEILEKDGIEFTQLKCNSKVKIY